jgi:hypothetical protein
MESVEVAVARVFREEYGRVLAPIVRVVGDLGRAEDIVQEAFSRAAEHWVSGGVPARPGAWVTTVARGGGGAAGGPAPPPRPRRPTAGHQPTAAPRVDARRRLGRDRNGYGYGDGVAR